LPISQRPSAEALRFRDVGDAAGNALLIIAGLAGLVVGGELLVRGASRLAAALGLQPVVIGLTVVAFGTSAPELAVGIQAAFGGRPDLIVGNVVGSNIYNVLLVLGLSALVAPLVVKQQLVRLDVPLMVGASVAMFVLALDGNIAPLEGLALFGLLLFYLVTVVRMSRREDPEVMAEYAREFGARPGRDLRAWLVNGGLVGGGLVALVLGADWVVRGAVATAEALGISELVIGLTVVAIGTSLPELVTSIVAAIRGERDLAVGNIVGSNIFNIMCVLALTAYVAPGGVDISSAALALDLPFMVAVGIACLPIFFTGHVIARWEGALFVLYGIGYTSYLVLDATAHTALPLFNLVTIAFVVPLTVLTLVLVTWRELVDRRARRDRRAGRGGRGGRGGRADGA
jgi:cation:H+ antiporter